MVGVATAEYLSAMKASAARQEADGANLRRLASILQFTSVQQASTWWNGSTGVSI